MGGGTELDLSTLLIGLAIIIFSVSLAQLFLLGISALIRRRQRQQRKNSDEEGNDLQ